MTDLWPHQYSGVHDTISAIEKGEKAIVLTSPTGMGKSRMVCEIINFVVNEWNWYAILYSNRKLLIEQLAGVLTKNKIDYGVRASGWSEEGKDFPVQISSLPTERQRTLNSDKWSIHGLGHKCLAIIDEVHINNGETAQAILKLHEEAGHVRLGVTATPLGLGEFYTHLIVAGKVKHGRECGALVSAVTYAPDEPDLKQIGRFAPGEDVSENQNRKLMGEVGTEKFYHLTAKVQKWIRQLNPDMEPTLIFAPGVLESVGIAEEFTKAGIPTAHIDGSACWFGEYLKNDRSVRESILNDFREGRIKVLTNRFVLREGIDLPEIKCGVFACVMGSLQTFLQAGGRFLRAHPGKENVTVIDFGGNWWRHGSLNADREWELHYTNAMISGMREDVYREKKVAEPYRCPECAKILVGPKCACGWEPPPGWKKSRPIIQHDGNLKLVTGDIFKTRTISKDPSGPEKWEKMYWRARSKKWNATFRQAMALFAQENNFAWPDRHWPFMPKNELDLFLKVVDVPPERLIQR